MHQPLVPMWLLNGKIRGLERMPERPVLMNFGTSTSYVRGEVVDLTPARAFIELSGSFMLFNKVQAQSRFRANDIIYTLTGEAAPRSKHDCITLTFDAVTRINMAEMQYFDEFCDAEPVQPESSTQVIQPAVRKKRTKEQQRIFYRMPPPGGFDRRESHRFEIDECAQLYVLDGNFSLNCVLLEASMTGCRLYSDLPFVLKENLEVEVQFHARGCPFRLHGIIRLKKDQEHIVGLHFNRFSGRKKEQLRELIEELRGLPQEQLR